MSEQRENFCGACVAGLTALAGAGTAGGTKFTKNTYKKPIFYTGLIISIISILYLIYLLCFGDCNNCA